ncbi:toll-like receptor 1 isoform X3 [Ostrea edulis]|nr:toll-like receptor 1 isoform X3 [Ostrea edulis]
MDPFTNDVGNRGLVWNCSRGSLDVIPNIPSTGNFTGIIGLDISFNKFRRISKSTFLNTTRVTEITSLYLDGNEIIVIESEAFSYLTALEILHISNCSLSKFTLRNSSFSRMENLKLLEILNNDFVYAGYPSRELSRLTSLQTLSISVFKRFSFDENFTLLRNLQTVLLYSQNSGIRLTNESFMGLRFSPITSLYIFIRQYGTNCDISDNVLQWFHVVRVLNMRISSACNVTRVLRSLKALEGHTMDYFIATYNVQEFGDPVVLDEWAVGPMLNMCIKTVNLAHNNIGSLAVDVKGTLFEKCIRDLDLSNNVWGSFHISFVRFLTSSNLKQFNLEGAWYLSDSFNFQIQRFLAPNVTVYLAKSLEKINFSHNKFHPVLLDHHKMEITLAANGLKELILHHSNIEGTIFTKFQCPNLVLLNISFMLLESDHYMFSCELFCSLKHLETLDATKASLNRILNHNADCFRGLKNLKSLNISSNELTFLHPEIFREQINTLETLNLDYNLLEVIPQAVLYMRFLSQFSLRFNKIKTISKTDYNLILNHFSDKSIAIEGNPLFCSCKYEQSIKFIRLIERKFDDIVILNCSEFDGKPPPNLHRLFEFSNWRAYQLSCVATFWLEFSSVLVCVAISITISVVLVCKYRIFLEYISLRLRLRLRGKKYETEKKHYEYDVFICYSAYDQNWVITELYQNLTNSDMKVCLDEKNFIPGRLIAEEIVRCIDESRKILFVITRNFLQSKWAGYEVQMAITHAFHNHVESKIVVLLKDKIPLGDMPEQLKRIWWKIVCSKWPMTGMDRDERLFWETLNLSISNDVY